MLDFYAVTENEKYLISEWKYPGEYSIYNSISYEEQIRTKRGFANPENNHFTFYEGEILVGYINLRKKQTAVYIGIGVAPDLCGKGYGQQIVSMACSLARGMFPGKEICMEVRTWNVRAIRCYEKVGFHIVGEPFTMTTPFGTGQFYKMSFHEGTIDEEKNNSFWNQSWESIVPERVTEYVMGFDMKQDPIIRFLQKKQLKNVCDAGCGCGIYSLKLLQQGFTVSGFDVAENAVLLTRTLLSEYGYPMDNFKRASVLSTEYPDGCFDAVIARDVIDHMSIYQGIGAIDELLRILRPGGYLLVTLDITDDEYESESHEISADGDYHFIQGKWRGMVFHPYSASDIKILADGKKCEIISSDNHGFIVMFEA